MYPSINQIKIHTLPVTYDNWSVLLEKPTAERPLFQKEGNALHIGQVIARFVGIPLDEDEYYNRLYDYVHNQGLILLSDESLDKTIDNAHFQSIQKIININAEQSLSINRFVAFLDGEKLLISSTSSLLHRKIREAAIGMFEFFAANEEGGLKSPELRRILVDVIKWSFNHLEAPLNDADPEKRMPAFLWYGDYKKSHQYFLYFVMKIGCDIVSFTPGGNDIFSLADPNKEQSFVHMYPEKKNPEPFPAEKRKRSATVAYRASREIETILNHEGSGLYKPWQLRDYTPSALTLKTTYDELFLLAKEKAMIRPNFEVKNGTVKVPALFAKINGVSRNRREYWDRLHGALTHENALLIKNFPLSSGANSDFRFHYRNALGKDGLLDPEKMAGTHYWKYGHLPTGLQKGLAAGIRNLCASPKLKPQHRENEEELKIYLFTQAMQVPEQILKMLQKFDYSQDVPKLILYNNELNGTMTRSDAALLLLLNQFGVDLIIYNPPGHNDIENFIDESAFDSHWLEDVVFEQEFKEPSIIKKVIFQGILKNLRGD
ncbi:YceG family protein [Mesobacillus subterraneus]|uniref:Putative component of 'biosynthetic module' domain-containing protein n=1 Tax=Mesobacillus subterraneus TaxID=285983 RepID=A0A3R9FEM6_9BACI|nr:YceG family protein [Mesobacillus subterraneus]RSD26290.1 hypothetical protein EJA10_15910 [Mesobacillus subterraneus]